MNYSLCDQIAQIPKYDALSQVKANLLGGKDMDDVLKPNKNLNQLSNDFGVEYFYDNRK